MEKTIITAFMIVAGVVSAVFFFNAIYPAVIQSGDAMVSMQRRMNERLRSQIDIVHATGYGGSNAIIWVKNVGSSSIRPIENCDVFFGPEGNYVRIPLETGEVPAPYWEWKVTNDSSNEWKPTATLQITIIYGSVLSGRYYIKVTTPNGVSDEYYFSE